MKPTMQFRPAIGWWCRGMVCMLSVIGLWAQVAAATPISLDDFVFPSPADVHFLPGGSNTSLTVTNAVAGVIGDEREIFLQAVGTVLPVTAQLLIGNENGFEALQVATLSSQNNVTVVTTLTYDGVGNVGLGGVDLKDNNSNNRFEIEFDGSDAQPTSGLGISITVTSNSGSSTATATALNQQTPFTVNIPFSSFLGSADLSAVNSIVVELNGDETPNVDFEIIGFSAVPEPGSCLLMALGGTLTCIQVARRGRNRRAS
jgi:hypothetical protein